MPTALKRLCVARSNQPFDRRDNRPASRIRRPEDRFPPVDATARKEVKTVAAQVATLSQSLVTRAKARFLYG